MRNYIIILLSVMLLGAANANAQNKTKSTHKKTTATHEKKGTAHKKTATAHKWGGADKSHKTAGTHKHGAAAHKSHGKATAHKGGHGHKKSVAHKHHNAPKVEEEVFTYPMARTAVPERITTAPAETISEDRATSTTDRDFDCYRAWRKDLKRAKKEYKAKLKEEQGRPWAADRKMRKAHKKAWKADMLEKEHKSGHDHSYERGYWWY